MKIEFVADDDEAIDAIGKVLFDTGSGISAELYNFDLQTRKSSLDAAVAIAGQITTIALAVKTILEIAKIALELRRKKQPAKILLQTATGTVEIPADIQEDALKQLLQEKSRLEQS